MTAFKVEVRDTEVIAAFNRLREAALRPEPALKAIGEVLYRQTRQTFETGTDPWGRRWAPNSPVTLAAMLAKRDALRKKDGKASDNWLTRGENAGRLNAGGARRVMAKKPLIGDGKFLSGPSLHYAVVSRELTLGSSAVYSAIQQFGGTKAMFPHLWGSIPARPFLPVDAAGNLAPQAQRAVVDVIQEYLLAQR